MVRWTSLMIAGGYLGQHLCAAQTSDTANTSAPATAIQGDDPTAAPSAAPSASYNESAGEAGIVLAVDAFQCATDIIDVSYGDQPLTCEVAAESSLGVSTISAAFYNVPMTKRLIFDFGSDQLASGSTLNGIWQATVTVPEAIDQGVWTLGFEDLGAFYGFEITDINGNIRSYDSIGASSAMSPLQSNLTVMSYTGASSAYPQANMVSSTGVSLTGVSCDQSVITATSTAQSLACSATIIPDAGGIGETTVYLVSPNGTTVLPIVFGEYSDRQAIEATANSPAMWSLSSNITVPIWVESGSYKIPTTGPYQPQSVSHAGTVRQISPTELTTTPNLLIKSVTDKAPPVITSFYCNSGRTVDLSANDPTNVSCLLKVNDDVSGVSYASLQFVSPTREDSLEFAYVPQSPDLGPFPVTAQKSVAETATVELAPFAEPGVWVLTKAVVTDNAGHYREYMATDLNAAQVQTFFMVQNPTQTFAIAPKAGSSGSDTTPGKSTSAAASGTGRTALLACLAAIIAAIGAWGSCT